MKAIRIYEFGASNVLTYINEPRPYVGGQEVLIKIEAAGVGRVDVSARQGNYAPLSQPGFIPGIEVAGEVIMLGKEADKDWLGKRVFARLSSGGYAEEVSVPVQALVEIPGSMTSLEAVAFGVKCTGRIFQPGFSQPGQRGSTFNKRGYRRNRHRGYADCKSKWNPGDCRNSFG